MEEAPENGKESSHSAHVSGVNELIFSHEIKTTVKK
jgi:pimeloyl-CoA synthetase